MSSVLSPPPVQTPSQATLDSLLVKDYELKVRYLTDHFSRMWTRFNYFVTIQTALLGTQKFLYPNWPYPPTLCLLMAPFALLPYLWSFVTWTFATLSATRSS